MILGKCCTVWCSYNAVNFLQNHHKRHPIVRPLERGMGCLLCIQTLYSASVRAVIYAISCYIGPHYNGTRLCFYIRELVWYVLLRYGYLYACGLWDFFLFIFMQCLINQFLSTSGVFHFISHVRTSRYLFDIKKPEKHLYFDWYFSKVSSYDSMSQ